MKKKSRLPLVKGLQLKAGLKAGEQRPFDGRLDAADFNYKVATA
jgi:hypothetical protein